MPNPKITISIDQSCVDAISKATAALERLCAAMEMLVAKNQFGIDTPSVAEPDKPAEPTPVVEAPVAPVTPVQVTPIPAPGMNGFDFTGAPVVAPAVEPVQNVVMPTVAPVVPAAPAAAVQMPTATAPALTMEMLGMAGSQLMSMGVNAQALLGEFGITRLSDLPPERYPDMAARMRQLGAKI